MAVFSSLFSPAWQSHRGSPVLAVLSLLFLPGSSVLAVLSCQTCAGCPFLADPSWFLWSAGIFLAEIATVKKFAMENTSSNQQRIFKEFLNKYSLKPVCRKRY
jgi:hypothetical protein